MKHPLTTLWAFAALAWPTSAQPQLTIDASQPQGKVSPTLYGLMTEEINHSYDGGLYAELIRNRAFLDDPAQPLHWSVIAGSAAAPVLSLDRHQPLNEAIPVSLRLDVAEASAREPAGLSNEGYWGIPLQPSTTYRGSFAAKIKPGTIASVRAALQSDDGTTVYAQAEIAGLSPQWRQYSFQLRTGAGITATTHAHFVLTVSHPGTLWLSLVSLFPPTWNDRDNGLRRDLMQMLVDLTPAFLRFPGGNYLEGDSVATRFDWKRTIGPISHRGGHPSPWGYRSTDGMGLLEFLLWCEDLRAEPVLAVYAGYSLKGEAVPAGPALQPFVQDALDEIEYVTGPADSPWGRRRARDGHPAPFPLRSVEIGNEDWFDKSGSYDARYAEFHDAIKQRYPHLACISTIGTEHPDSMRVHARKADLLDEHYYASYQTFLSDGPHHFESYDRAGPKIFVGEWAAYETSYPPWDKPARKDAPTPNMQAAIGDAVWMAAMERNSDVIAMQCYAPLLANVNGRQWRPNLIGYDAISAYGSPSYYAFRMFSANHGDEILHCEFNPGGSLQASVTRSHLTGTLYLKVINPSPQPQSLQIVIRGAPRLNSAVAVETLAADPAETNSLSDPRHVVPVPSQISGGANFEHAIPPCSITTLKLFPAPP